MPKLKNPKHELLAKNIVEQKFNLTKAYQETFPNASYDSARGNVHRIANDCAVVSRVEEIAQKKGYTPEHIIQTLYDATLALKNIFHNGVLISSEPDWAARLDSAKTGLKLHGFVGNHGDTNNIDARSVSIQLDKSDVNRLEDVARMMQGIRVQISQESDCGVGGVGVDGDSVSP